MKAEKFSCACGRYVVAASVNHSGRMLTNWGGSENIHVRLWKGCFQVKMSKRAA